MTEEQLQAIEEYHTKMVRFFEITRKDLGAMVTWRDGVPVDEFWEMFGAARNTLDDTPRLIAEVRRLSANLDAVDEYADYYSVAAQQFQFTGESPMTFSEWIADANEGGAQP